MSDTVYLKADADFEGQVDRGTFYYSLDGVHWDQLGDTQQMSYSTNNHFMGYRFALYSYATTELGGHVDFDYYRISDQLKGALVSAVPSASVERVDGNANNLTVTVTWSRGPVKEITETFLIRNNWADTFEVGPYRVFVDTQDNTQIRKIEVVE